MVLQVSGLVPALTPPRLEPSFVFGPPLAVTVDWLTFLGNSFPIYLQLIFSLLRAISGPCSRGWRGGSVQAAVAPISAY